MSAGAGPVAKRLKLRITRQLESTEFVPDPFTVRNAATPDRMNHAYLLDVGNDGQSAWATVGYNRELGSAVGGHEIKFGVYEKDEKTGEMRSKGKLVTLNEAEARQLMELDVQKLLSAKDFGTFQLGDRHRVVVISQNNGVEVSRIIPYVGAEGNIDAPAGQLADSGTVQIGDLEKLNMLLPVLIEMAQYAKAHLKFAPRKGARTMCASVVDRYLPHVLLGVAKAEAELKGLLGTDRVAFKIKVQEMLTGISEANLYGLIMANECNNIELMALSGGAILQCVEEYLRGPAAVGNAMDNLIQIVSGRKHLPMSSCGRPVKMSGLHMYQLAVAVMSLFRGGRAITQFMDDDLSDVLDIGFCHFDAQHLDVGLGDCLNFRAHCDKLFI